MNFPHHFRLSSGGVWAQTPRQMVGGLMILDNAADRFVQSPGLASDFPRGPASARHISPDHVHRVSAEGYATADEGQED